MKPQLLYDNELYRALPKVELHRHLEGSLRLGTMIEIARTYGLTLPKTGGLRSLVQMEREQPYTFRNFLSKFETLRLFYRSPEIIVRITREAIEDAALDNVRYLELRFTPMALGKVREFPLPDVIGWVIEGARQAQAEFGIPVRLIASVNRNEPVAIAEKVAQLVAERNHQEIVGLDLAGNEAEFSARPFAGVFAEARQAGIRICVHAGEWGGAGNVIEAITALGAERIGHGVRVLEDPDAVALARERNVVFEVCLTSNFQSGVVSALKAHPIRQMMSADLNVTLNTDDPSISQIRLSDEYRIAREELGISLAVLGERTLAAAQAAFLPDGERDALVTKLRGEWETRRQSAVHPAK